MDNSIEISENNTSKNTMHTSKNDLSEITKCFQPLKYSSKNFVLKTAYFSKKKCQTMINQESNLNDYFNTINSQFL